MAGLASGVISSSVIYHKKQKKTFTMIKRIKIIKNTKKSLLSEEITKKSLLSDFFFRFCCAAPQIRTDSNLQS